MTLLQSIIIEIPSNDMHQQLRLLCDKIQKEECETINDGAPQGPNILLSLRVPGKYKRQCGFLTLEREFDGYICCLYNYSISRTTIQNSWVIDGKNSEKILTEYAKRYKFLKGE